MKLIYSSLVAMAFAGMLSIATAAESQSGTQQPGQQEQPRLGAIKLQKGFIRQGDKIFKIERVTKATKLEGIEVDEQGNLTKDGKKMELKEGQLVSPDAEPVETP